MSDRENRYAELIGRLYLQTSGGGVHSIEDIARAVMAVADEEQAELRAEIERLHLGGSYDLAAAEAKHDTLRAAMDRVADEWEAHFAEFGITNEWDEGAHAAFKDFRDALRKAAE